MAVVVTVAKGYDIGYIWKTQAEPGAGRSTGGYYINAAQGGEPPGRRWGPGAQALGFSPGQLVERQPYDAVYQQIDPRTGARLGRPRGRYPTFADHLARLTATEPHATAERLIELEREAARMTRQPAAYTDVTISFSKSISVLHASIRENGRRARLAADWQAAAYWAGQEAKFQEILHEANRAAPEYLQTWAGFTRTGYRGVRVDGRDPGRFETAGLIVTSWLQGTSRDGDPQEHIHNQVARTSSRTYCDGKWRALDTASLRAVPGALQAIAATAVECALTREFGVAWVPRADGRGHEIRGITQAQLDAYSTRTVQVHEKERELARAWERRHGRAPTSRELLHIANDATLQSRRGKDAGAVDWDALAPRWDATLGGELAGIAPVVSNARGAGLHEHEHHGGHAPTGPPTPETQARALAKALVLVSDKHPTWTRHDLLKQLALVMPAETRQLDPQAAQELLLGLAKEALSGRTGEVLCLEAPEWPRVPASLRRGLDGRSIYTRPGVTQYATTPARPDPAAGQRRFTRQAFRYDGYRSSDLAYAITGHSAQGATVHTAITLVTGGEDRQWLYPALTRGTDVNLAFVFTTPPRPADPRPGTRPAPELGRYDSLRREHAGYLPAQLLGGARQHQFPPGDPVEANPREPVAVLADVLARDGAARSASAIRQRNLANADHLATLHAIWTAETRAARDDRYRQLVMAKLPPGYRCRAALNIPM